MRNRAGLIESTVLGRVVTATLAVVALALPARGSEPEVRKVRIAHGGESRCSEQGRVVTMDTAQDPSDFLSVPTAIPGEVALALDPERSWTIRLDAEGCWSPEVLVDPQREGEVLEIVAFPSALLSGKIESLPRVEPPSILSFRVAPVGSPKGSRGSTLPILTAAVACPVEEAAFSCRIPAGHLDLRIEAEGFAPHYLWDLRADAGTEVATGTLTLRAGSSLRGLVVLAEDRSPATGAKVELVPAVAGPGLDDLELERIRLRSQETETDDHGFFQLAGLSSGTYDLRISREGLARAEIPRIAVPSDGREVVLDEPVVLESLKLLEVFLTPAVDPEGQPWEIDLLREEKGGQLTELPAGPPSTDETGFWKAQGLDPGNYHLHVRDRWGSRWRIERIKLAPLENPPPLHLEIPYVLVEGWLHAGEDPIQGVLYFGGRFGSESLQMNADLEGRFSGALPREGIWKLDLARSRSQGLQTVGPVKVERRRGHPVARLDIELPDTAVRGRVVDRKGEPIPGALIELFQEEKRRVEATLTADLDGEFEIAGLEPGPMTVVARLQDRTSRPARLLLQEDPDAPRLELVLAPLERIGGEVRHPGGAVAGAVVKAVPLLRSGGGVSVAQAVTGVDGGFSLEIEPEAWAVDLVVLAPGFAAKVVRVPLGSEQPIQVVVEADSGSLRIRGPADALGPNQLLLSHGAATVNLVLLLDWIRLHDAGPSEPGEIVVPALEVGEYQVCAPLAGDLEEGRCSSGFLPPGGELPVQLGTSTASAIPEK